MIPAIPLQELTQPSTVALVIDVGYASRVVPPSGPIPDPSRTRARLVCVPAAPPWSLVMISLAMTTFEVPSVTSPIRTQTERLPIPFWAVALTLKPRVAPALSA